MRKTYGRFENNEIAKEKPLIFIINGMFGGGAERVMTLLVNNSAKKGYDTYFVLANQKVQDAQTYDIDSNVHLLSLDDVKVIEESKENWICRVRKVIATVLFRGTKKMGMPIPEYAIYHRFIAKHGDRVSKLRLMLTGMPDATIVAFLDYPIQLSLLATEGLPNKLIISERGNPQLHDDSINASYFIRKHYKRADSIVFQTRGAASYYSNELQGKGVIISNPIMGSLPTAVQGGYDSRQRVVVNFCRISREKNLKLLIAAFIEFWTQHKDFKLQIIGDANDSDSQLYLRELFALIIENKMKDIITILPFSPDCHKQIINYSMFVSSSNFEGMSNSMLEAMAIGLPTICTDCPSGGAREIIEDGVNGILVPVNDKSSMARAMTRVADDAELANRLSVNGSKIRVSLSEDTIYEKWEQIM